MLAHINTHSHFSFLFGLPKIKQIILGAKEKGFSSVGLTDINNLCGVIEFYKTCQKEEMKPIIGSTFIIGSNSEKKHKVLLLAQTTEGYKNLIKITTKANVRKDTEETYIDDENLNENRDGIICILPPHNSEISNLAESKVKKVIDKYKKIFEDNLYIGLSRNQDLPDYDEKKLIKISNDYNIPYIPCNLIYYIDEDDKAIRDILLKVNNKRLDDVEDEILNSSKLHMPDVDELKHIYSDLPDALKNLEELVKSVNVEITLGEWTFPHIETDDPEKDLNEKIESGIKKRKLEDTKELRDRIAMELDVINNTGYTKYFLSVIEIIDFMHENKIVTTTRGSAAGCMVSYLTNITNVNPLEFALPFERFLNKERPSPPDIDIDVSDVKRDEVIDWIKERFGSKSVAQIGTFGTFMARASVRDVSRALGYSYTLGDRIAKLIPLGKQGFPMYIDIALEKVPELLDLYNDTDTRYKEVIDISKKIEGNVRHISVHAAGVVISPTRVDDYIPVQFERKNNKLITQFDMHACEDAGLLKFDILGLRNLSILGDCIYRVKKRFDIDVDIENIPFDDEKTFDLLSKGYTVGVFQLNGNIITQFLKELKPTTIHDINAMVALYRPGPMKNIPEYIKRKHKKSKVVYAREEMKDFLENSYGILVYQEDIMFTALSLAGYTWKTVDKLRKAIGKKIPEEMAKQEKVFIEGCIEHSDMTETKAREIWDLFVPFQGYGFNKAHAASYGRVSYQTAYMKANYPDEYMASIFSSDTSGLDKIQEYHRECINLGIELLPPKVNQSFGKFVTEGENKIRYGLFSIKNLGENVSEKIIEEREKEGEYKSLADFLERIAKYNVLNKKSLESLIKTNCLSDWSDIETLMKNIETMGNYVRDFKKEREDQSSLFGEVKSSIKLSQVKDSDKITQEQKLFWERDLLGFYASGHPLEKIADDTKVSLDDVKTGTLGAVEDLLCIINKVSKLDTKNGYIAFVDIEDMSGAINCVCWNEPFEEYKDLLIENRPILISGNIKQRDNEFNIYIDKIKEFE